MIYVFGRVAMHSVPTIQQCRHDVIKWREKNKKQKNESRNSVPNGKWQLAREIPKRARLHDSKEMKTEKEKKK